MAKKKFTKANGVLAIVSIIGFIFAAPFLDPLSFFIALLFIIGMNFIFLGNRIHPDKHRLRDLGYNYESPGEAFNRVARQELKALEEEMENGD